jgi:hypothetical protein
MAVACGVIVSPMQAKTVPTVPAVVMGWEADTVMAAPLVFGYSFETRNMPVS